jgi:hypothetical protein
MPKSPIKPPLLVNAWEKAKAHPDRFEVPHPSVLRNLRAGDFVKVCDDRERFWLQIVARRAGDIFLARVVNALLFSDLELGDFVELHACNIYDVHRDA